MGKALSSILKPSPSLCGNAAPILELQNQAKHKTNLIPLFIYRS
jgi:hypothetical protein